MTNHNTAVGLLLYFNTLATQNTTIGEYQCFMYLATNNTAVGLLLCFDVSEDNNIAIGLKNCKKKDPEGSCIYSTYYFINSLSFLSACSTQPIPSN